MHKKLAESTSYNPVGLSFGQKIFKIQNGRFAGRLAALMQGSATEIKLRWSDAPYTVWSETVTIANDAADDAFDARMDNDGSLFIAYAEDVTRHLVFRKLSFSDGVWTVGTKVTIYNSGSAYTPSVGREYSGKLWVTWSDFQSPHRYIRVKSSVDDGAIWGSGAADAGTQLTTGDTMAYSRLLITTTHIRVIATYDNYAIVMRSIPISGGSWSAEEAIASTTASFGSDFDAAVADDGRIGVVFNNPYFRYREFDGSNWGAIVPLAAVVGGTPQLLFRAGIPAVIYLQSWVGAQKIQMYTDRRAGQFSTPTPLDLRAKTFDRVLLYNQAAASFVDMTTAAANAATGDLFHPASSCLLKNSGDQLYLGMQRQFRYLQVLLSTLGSEGTVVFSYWNGANWQSFTPDSGAVPFTADPARIVLWDDYVSIPADWQKKSINGHQQFWVRIEVNSPFGVGPVGSQVTSIAEILQAICRR